MKRNFMADRHNNFVFIGDYVAELRRDEEGVLRPAEVGRVQEINPAERSFVRVGQVDRLARDRSRAIVEFDDGVTKELLSSQIQKIDLA